MSNALRLISDWPARRWIAASIGALVAALAMAVPTGLVPTDLYTRMTPVRWWDYPIWIASSSLIGLSLATYVRKSEPQLAIHPCSRSGRTIGASLLTVFAIGCPVCNKLVVTVLGYSGALTYFAPLQPVLGVAGVALLGLGLAVRLRGERSCAVAVAEART